MNTPQARRSQPFGIGTRTEIRLDPRRLLTVPVSAGDLLRSGGGTVWATIDGEPDDILLSPGDVHVVSRDCALRVSGLGHARLEVYGHGPLRYEPPRERLDLRALAQRALRRWRRGPVWSGRTA